MKRHLFFSLIIIIGILIYSNSFHCTFLLDDTPVLKNAEEKPFGEHLKYFFQFKARSLAMLTFKLNLMLHKYWLPGFHFFNLGIHLTNGILVYLILRKLCGLTKTKMQYLPLWGTLIFVCHPVQVQAVTYIAQRFTVLATLFYYAAILLYLNIREIVQKNGSIIFHYAILILLIIFANLSKENAITVPFTILLIEFLFFPQNKFQLKRKILFYLPIFIAGLLSLISRLIPGVSVSVYDFVALGLKDTLRHTPYQYLSTQMGIIVKYIWMLFVPVKLHFIHRDFICYDSFFHLPVILAFLLHLIIIILGIRNCRRNPIFSFGILFFYLALSVESSIFPIEWPMFEHRLYLPMLGFSAFLPLAIRATGETFLYNKPLISKKLLHVTMGVFVFILAGLTYQRNIIFQSPVSVWEESVRLSPGLSFSHGNLAAWYFYNGRYEEAVREFRESLRILNGDREKYNRGLAMSYIILGEIDKGMGILEEKGLLSSLNADEHYKIAQAYYQKGEETEALKHYQIAVWISPQVSYLRATLAVMYLKLGNEDKFKEEIDIATKLDPDNPQLKKLRKHFYGLIEKGNLKEK